MGALIFMLVGALLPTGNNTEDTPQASYAICFYTDLGPYPKNLGYNDPFRYASMIVSVLLIGVGFISRVVRLHKTFSVTLVARARRYLSNKALKFPRKEY